jgi:hypothetical protein
LVACLVGLPVGGVFGWTIHMGTRGAIRNMHNIPGGACDDCVMAAFCESCAIVQEDVQLQSAQAKPMVMAAPVVMQMVQPVVMQPAVAVAQPMPTAMPTAMAQPMAPPMPTAQAVQI